MDADLSAAIAAAEGRAMVWGRDDCCLWVADIVRARTGLDGAAAFRGRYRSRHGAAKALKAVHGGGLIEAITAIAAQFGWPVIDADAAADGDIAIIDTTLGPALAIMSGDYWIGRIDGGVSATPRDLAVKAWRVTCRPS